MPKGMYISVSGDKRCRRRMFIAPVKYLPLQFGKEYRLPFFSVLILTLLGLLAIHPMPFHSGYVAAGPGTTKPSTTSITLTSTANETTVALTPNLGFILSNSADTATYGVLTDNFSGYTLKIKAADDNQTLVNTVDSTKTIDSITTPIEQTNFAPITAGLINHWGIKPSKYYDTTSSTTISNTTKILPAPTTTGTILDKTIVANSTANSYDIAIGAMVDGSLPAGTYVRDAILEVVANELYYAISYDQNTADNVTNMPAAQTDTAFVDQITLSSDTPTRDHYTFLGWCLGSTTNVNNVDTCTDGAGGAGTVFQPGDNFGIDQTTANITTLYAMWSVESVTVTLTAGTGIDTVAITGSGVKTGGTAGATSTAEVYYNGEITITATPSAGYAFTDWTGDATYTNNPETIASITADLALTANAEQATIMQNFPASECTADPTTVVDIRDGKSYTIRRINGTCWMTQNLAFTGKTGDPEGTMTLDSTTSNISSDYTVDNPQVISYINFSTGNKYDTAQVQTGDITTWYNYAAATAMTIATNNDSSEVTSDICPKGWHLPADPGAFTIDDRNAFSPTTGGMYYNKTITNPNFGYWWLSTVSSATNRYYMLWSGSSLFRGSSYNHYRYMGMSIRCVLDETSTMQGFTDADASSIPAGESVTLKDIRDNERYTVTKLSDGNVWMTQNLRFTGTKLTPADSNVGSNITMNYGDLTTGNSYTQALIHNSGDLTKGVWYNFAAASAGTIASASSSSNATQDVCPAGWRLPTNIEIENIVANSTSFNPTNNTGYWYNGTNAATTGGYWYSSSSGGAIARYGLNYVSGSYLVSEGGDRATGRNIRCIYDNSVDMQNISQSDLNALVPSTGDTATLRDARDGELYRVTKLADGNVWMTQNLRFVGNGTVDSSGNITGSMNLDPATSNVPAATNFNYADLTSGDSYDPSIHRSADSTVGTWYNYAATSANSIKGTSNTDSAAQSLCPAGWRLPTGSEQADIASYKTDYAPITSGRYWNGSWGLSTTGLWWSSTAYDGTNRYDLRYTNNTLYSYGPDAPRVAGFYIRCIYDTPIIYMQDFSNMDAGGMGINDFKTLTDSRDGQTYKVAKLADGNIWMIDNLNLNASTITATELDSTNTNLEPGETLAVNIFKGWQTLSAISTYTNGQYIPVAGTDSTSLTKNGTLYNYCAASAGTNCFSSNLSNSASDICPKGWRLPTGGSTGEYQKLYDLAQYNDLAKMRNPIGSNGAAFALPGYFNTGTPIANTAYWTSMVQAATKAYAMSINTTYGATPSNYGERSLGFSVRCIYDSPITMQNFSDAEAAAMVTNEVKTLVDSRDNKKYTVSKLADGNIWMTKNLSFTGTTLTPADSNVSETVTMNWDNLAGGTNSYTGPQYQDSGTAVGGYWYNYAAASAKSVTGDSTTDEATQSICPAGWRLPTHDEQQTIVSYVTQFGPSPTDGAYDNGAINAATFTYYWSSTAASADKRYGLYFSGTDMNTRIGSRNGDRGMGLHVRCVYDGNNRTMQNFSAADVQSMSTGDTAVLTDARDGQNYTVTKLSDGNVWMTRNLAIGCDGTGQTYGTNNVARTLTSADSNVFVDYSLPTTTNSSGNNYNNSYTTCDAEFGAYYNYAAASAKSVIGSSNTNIAAYDICPAGWRLPTNTEQSAILSDVSIFNPSKEGYWYNGSFSNNNAGGWWSSVASNATSRYYLRYENNALSVYSPSSGRYLAIAVRCIKAPDITTATYMQDVTSAMISSTKVGTTTTLTDSRDNQTYKVTRLEDGKLWMQDNLSLDLTDSVVLNNMSSTNTNANATALNYLKNGGGTTSNQWAINGVANWGYTDYSYSQPLVNTSGNCSSTLEAYPCSYTGAYTKDSIAPNTTGIGVGSHKIGVYYNYCAATAGSYCYGSGSSSEGAPSGSATQDICPAGWRLPTGGASGEYQALCTAINGSNCGNGIVMDPTDPDSMQYKLSTTYAGNFGGNYFAATTRQGTAGFFWASNYSTTGRMGGIWVTQSNNTINPQGDLARWGANSIRCVSK